MNVHDIRLKVSINNFKFNTYSHTKISVTSEKSLKYFVSLSVWSSVFSRTLHYNTSLHTSHPNDRSTHPFSYDGKKLSYFCPLHVILRYS